MVAGLGAILAVVFGLLWLYFRSRGGYRAVHISDRDEVGRDKTANAQLAY